MSGGTADPGVPNDRWLSERARALAATQRGTAGLPRAFTVSPDGHRLCWLRAVDGEDTRLGLWTLRDGVPALLVDPGDLGDEATVPDAERARRERTRERGSGLTSYAATPALDVVTFAYDGRLHVVSVPNGDRRVLDVPGPVADPRPSPTGRHVAWVRAGALLLVDLADGAVRTLADDDDPAVSWGQAEFIAAEEMGRTRGWWWAPDGAAIAACRVDETAVAQWWLHEPLTPAAPPRPLRYPAAGSANAAVSLAVVDLDGTRREVTWDHAAFGYLAAVRWDPGTPLTLTVQTRDQRRVRVLTADAHAGPATPVRTVHAEPWVELVPGVPRWTPDGRLVTAEDDPAADTRRVCVDGEPASPPGLHVDAVLGVRRDAVVLAGNDGDPTTTAVWRVPLDGGRPDRLTPPDGVHVAVASENAVVVRRQRDADPAEVTTAHLPGATVDVPAAPVELPLRPHQRLTVLDGLHAALVLPSWHRGERLPVLLDPYGGPHARRVRQAARAHLSSQWFAEAGVAVLVIDGRGTPGRGLAWEHAVDGDLATPALEDQERGLSAAADRWPFLDVDRVAIRGWSFGGYLAALAVLRRPETFHAAIAGAPVTDWRLYDTHYTERYLGDPADRDAAYTASSLLADAPTLRRPLLLLHGLADDNVVVAHTLALSEALVAAGRPHTVLPLSTTTHVARDPGREAGLLELQLAFLRDVLALPSAHERSQ